MDNNIINFADLVKRREGDYKFIEEYRLPDHFMLANTHNNLLTLKNQAVNEFYYDGNLDAIKLAYLYDALLTVFGNTLPTFSRLEVVATYARKDSFMVHVICADMIEPGQKPKSKFIIEASLRKSEKCSVEEGVRAGVIPLDSVEYVAKEGVVLDKDYLNYLVSNMGKLVTQVDHEIVRSKELVGYLTRYSGVYEFCVALIAEPDIFSIKYT